MSAIVWVHEDCLRPGNPALLAYPQAPAAFIWEDAMLEAGGYSLKRVVFVYECLLELPVEIYRGPVVETLLALAEREGAEAIATAESLNPVFAETVLALERNLRVEIHAGEEFLPREMDADLRRFARFWKRAEAHAFRRTSPPRSAVKG